MTRNWVHLLLATMVVPMVGCGQHSRQTEATPLRFEEQRVQLNPVITKKVETSATDEQMDVRHCYGWFPGATLAFEPGYWTTRHEVPVYAGDRGLLYLYDFSHLVATFDGTAYQRLFIALPNVLRPGSHYALSASRDGHLQIGQCYAQAFGNPAVFTDIDLGRSGGSVTVVAWWGNKVEVQLKVVMWLRAHPEDDYSSFTFQGTYMAQSYALNEDKDAFSPVPPGAKAISEH